MKMLFGSFCPTAFFRPSRHRLGPIPEAAAGFPRPRPPVPAAERDFFLIVPWHASEEDRVPRGERIGRSREPLLERVRRLRGEKNFCEAKILRKAASLRAAPFRVAKRSPTHIMASC
jgi:hypothetical protein